MGHYGVAASYECCDISAECDDMYDMGIELAAVRDRKYSYTRPVKKLTAQKKKSTHYMGDKTIKATLSKTDRIFTCYDPSNPFVNMPYKETDGRFISMRSTREEAPSYKMEIDS